MIPDLELRYHTPVTVSRQIADWLAARVRAGEFEPDLEPLPSEKQLMQMFPGVCRETCRRAVELLREEGLVYTLPQRGTYVPRR